MPQKQEPLQTIRHKRRGKRARASGRRADAAVALWLAVARSVLAEAGQHTAPVRRADVPLWSRSEQDAELKEPLA